MRLQRAGRHREPKDKRARPLSWRELPRAWLVPWQQQRLMGRLLELRAVAAMLCNQRQFSAVDFIEEAENVSGPGGARMTADHGDIVLERLLEVRDAQRIVREGIGEIRLLFAPECIGG